MFDNFWIALRRYAQLMLVQHDSNCESFYWRYGRSEDLDNAVDLYLGYIALYRAQYKQYASMIAESSDDPYDDNYMPHSIIESSFNAYADMNTMYKQLGEICWNLYRETW